MELWGEGEGGAGFGRRERPDINNDFSLKASKPDHMMQKAIDSTWRTRIFFSEYASVTEKKKTNKQKNKSIYHYPILVLEPDLTWAHWVLFAGFFLF